MAQQGIFISFEGGDGVGKSTQVATLQAALQQLGHEVVATREPGGTPLGRQLRELILHGADMAPRAEALLYAADRAHHVSTVIAPALQRGAVVITDRYLDSSLAYQAGGRQQSEQMIRDISYWAAQDILPDLTVLLDLDPAQAAQRWQGEPDRLESSGSEFHRRTREAFLALAAQEPQRWLVLDGGQTPVQVAAEVWQGLTTRFPDLAR